MALAGGLLAGAAAAALRASSRQLAVGAAALPDGSVGAGRRTALLLAPALAGIALSAQAEEQPAPAATEVGAVFVGRYSDKNHPGGYREIKLLGDGRAEVQGGGGLGEPKFYTLPATVRREGDLEYITIDFKPKGGPPNFTGVWDKDGITFLRDKNHWPKRMTK